MRIKFDVKAVDLGDGSLGFVALGVGENVVVLWLVEHVVKHPR